MTSERIDLDDPRVVAAIDRYWRKNLTVMAALLFVWAVVGLGCGVLFASALNEVSIGGFPLGFWFAQQGSIVVFVLLILIYALVLNHLDASHHRELERVRADRDRLGGEPRAPELPQAPELPRAPDLPRS